MYAPPPPVSESESEGKRKPDIAPEPTYAPVTVGKHHSVLQVEGNQVCVCMCIQGERHTQRDREI